MPLVNRNQQPTSDEGQTGEIGPEELLSKLAFPAGPLELVRILHTDVGLSRAEIARAASATTVTVGRWLETDETHVRDESGLADLRVVVMYLLNEGRISIRGIRFWLSARDLQLGTDALTAIGSGRLEEVLSAARELTRLRRVASPA